jgi:hypothetical protein
MGAGGDAAGARQAVSHQRLETALTFAQEAILGDSKQQMTFDTYLSIKPATSPYKGKCGYYKLEGQ